MSYRPYPLFPNTTYHPCHTITDWLQPELKVCNCGNYKKRSSNVHYNNCLFTLAKQLNILSYLKLVPQLEGGDICHSQTCVWEVMERALGELMSVLSTSISCVV